MTLLHETKTITNPAPMTRAAPRAGAKRNGPPASNQSRAASVAPGSYDAEARIFRAILSTGAAVRRGFGFEELSMDPAAVDLSRVPLGQVKFLDSHNQGAVGAIIGTLIDARFENGLLVGTVQLAESDAARAIERDIAAGHIKGVSIGYRVDQWTLVSAGDVETWRADKWALLEVSAVSVPADAGAMIRAEEEDSFSPPPRSESALSAREIRDIQRLSDSFGLRRDADALIDEGKLSRSAILETLIQKAGARQEAGTAHLRGPCLAVNMESNHMNGESFSFDNPNDCKLVLADYLAVRHFKMKPERPATQEVVGLRVNDALAFLSGHRGPSWRAPNFVERIFGADQTRAGLTTSDLQFALGSAMTRKLRETMSIQETGAARIVALDTVPDFRTRTEVFTSNFGPLQKTLEGAEIKYGKITDGGETYKVETYAAGLAVTFQSMMNDDLGAVEKGVFTTATAAIDAKAKVILGALSAKMSDGKTLFHLDHRNLGTAGAVGRAGAIRKAQRKRRGQRDGAAQHYSEADADQGGSRASLRPARETL